jgi:hypothetical protein
MTTSDLAATDIVETIMNLPTAGGVFDVLEENEYRLAAINQAALSLFQAQRPNPQGRLVSQLEFSVNAASRLTAMAKRCVESSAAEIFEESFVLRDGNTIHVSVSWVPIVESKQVRQLVFTATDITDLVNLRMQKSRELALFASAFLKTCAWCGNVEADGQWVSARAYVAENGPVEEMLCPDCRNRSKRSRHCSTAIECGTRFI